jgi:hypothetical protein
MAKPTTGETAAPTQMYGAPALARHRFNWA